MSEEVSQATHDVAYWQRRATAAEQRERIAAEAYNGQQQSYRELETLYQASQERALRAEANAAALRKALDGTTRMLQERSNNRSRAWTWMRALVAANQEVLNLWNIAAAVDHRGVAFTIRYNRAKAVVECWKRQPHYYDDCDPGQNDPYYAWYAEMDTLVTAFYASLKEIETQ